MSEGMIVAKYGEPMTQVSWVSADRATLEAALVRAKQTRGVTHTAIAPITFRGVEEWAATVSWTTQPVQPPDGVRVEDARIAGALADSPLLTPSAWLARAGITGARLVAVSRAMGAHTDLAAFMAALSLMDSINPRDEGVRQAVALAVSEGAITADEAAKLLA
jgi:hypothetical protein